MSSSRHASHLLSRGPTRSASISKKGNVISITCQTFRPPSTYLFAHTNAVLASASAIHADGAQHEFVVEVLGRFNLFGILRVNQHEQVEVAVTDVADNRSNKIMRDDIFFSLFQAVCK